MYPPRKLRDMPIGEQSAVRKYFAYCVYGMPHLCTKCGRKKSQLLVVYLNPDLISVERHNITVVCRECFSKMPGHEGYRGGAPQVKVDDETKQKIRDGCREGKSVKKLMDEFDLGRRVITRILNEVY